MNELAIFAISLVASALVWAAGYAYGKQVGLSEALGIVREGKEEL